MIEPKLKWHEIGRLSQYKLITYNGKTQNMTEWAKELGIDKRLMWKRLNTWRNFDLAMTAPKGTKGKHQ